MPSKLVIVESPAKARTIAGYLGKGFVVESSIGHIRDLPGSASDIPAAFKGEPWARLGVDVENDFKPLYVVPADKKKQVTKLKRLLKDADEVYLATDEDREGESIAWHLLEVLNPKQPVHRMVFHEITPVPSTRRWSIPASSTDAWWTPRRRGASSTGSTGTRCPRCCGARCARGSPPAGSSLPPPGSSSTGSGSGWPSSAPRTGG